jgi:hypothetical protein
MMKVIVELNQEQIKLLRISTRLLFGMAPTIPEAKEDTQRLQRQWFFPKLKRTCWMKPMPTAAYHQ